jgi:hypothetical protein
VIFVADEYKNVDVWVGNFVDEDAAEAYFEEDYSGDDDTPISLFARDQGVNFYDHDFMEFDRCEPSNDIELLLKGHSFAGSYIEAVRIAYQAAGAPEATFKLLMFNREIGNPRSVSSDERRLTYLGRFDCDPSCDREIPPGDEGPPNQISLLLMGDRFVTFEGAWTNRVDVTTRGLVIGFNGSSTDSPYLDLSELVKDGELYPQAARIYTDQFGQWVFENIMTGEKSMPWHGIKIALGTVEFEWECDSSDQ